jgi:hypothetical protein
MVNLRVASRLTEGRGKACWTIFVVLILLVALSACVYEERRPGPYQEPAGDISGRISNQQMRIDQGVASGLLTRREADVVQGNLNYIRNEYSRFQVEGRLPHGEHVRLNGLLDQNSEMIYREKHNAIRQLY